MAVPAQAINTHGVVAVGASAGGVEALSLMVAGFAPDLPYIVLVVLHLPPGGPSVLGRILDRAGPLPAVVATDGERLRPGTIYVCSPNRHLLADDHRAVLSDGPTENGHRPAINALFRSVAVTFGPRAVGVLLSGALDDGVLGLAAIRSRGGTTVCQSPTDATFPMLPTNALAARVVDHESAARDIGELLRKIADRPIEERVMEPDLKMQLENRIAMARRFTIDFDTEQLGPPSGYTCPDCNGSLVALNEGNYRCRVGHAWTVDALLHARDDEVESALWVAVRSLQEKATLARKMAGNLREGMLHDRYISQAEESEHALRVLEGRLSTLKPGHD